MRLIKMLICCAVLLLICTTANATTLAKTAVPYQSGSLPLNYNQLEDYIRIYIRNLENQYPDQNSFWENLFIKREQFGICSVTVSAPNMDNQTTILYTYEKLTGNKYTHNSIHGIGAYKYPITDFFSFPKDGTIKIKLQQRHWTGKSNISLLKQFLDFASSTGGIIQSIASEETRKPIIVAESLFKIIDIIFPTSDKTQTKDIAFTADDLIHSMHSISIQETNQKILDIQLKVSRPIFEKGYENGLAQDRFNTAFQDEEIHRWRSLIQDGGNIAKQTRDDTALISTMRQFSRYVDQSNMSLKDKSIFIAGSLSKWIPRLSSCSKDYCITKEEVYCLPGVSKEFIASGFKFKNNPCPGLEENRSYCIAFGNFKKHCATDRKSASKYINKTFNVIIGNFDEVFQVTKQEFESPDTVSLFFLNKDPKPDIKEEALFKFEANQVYFKHKDKEQINTQGKKAIFRFGSQEDKVYLQSVHFE